MRLVYGQQKTEIEIQELTKVQQQTEREIQELKREMVEI